jgi:phosphoglycolate phosphatase-like HAD superfamily hydrolase
MTAASFAAYRTWLFDCDGVLLDSNGVKTDAFHAIARSYGADAARRLVAHHQRHGGVSRFDKVRYLFDHILHRPPRTGEAKRLIEQFGREVTRQLGTVAVEPDAARLLSMIAAGGGSSHVVSGGYEPEVRAVLDQRELAHRFVGIHGSPRSKADIVCGLMAAGAITAPAVFVGDSSLDRQQHASAVTSSSCPSGPRCRIGVTPSSATM